jgi:16S rRNA (uracil1498-N3)-methyltransferase
VLKEIGKLDARCDIAAMHRKYHEPSLDVTLAVSLLKNPSRMEYVVEKATELGIRSFIPLMCDRTVAKGDKHDRLEKVALAAMKQCGRSWLPRIQPLQRFDQLIGTSAPWSLKFIPHEQTAADRTIRHELQHITEVHTILILIGPEGGFSEEEILLSEQRGFKQVTLGSRRLRTDTAAVAASAQLLT